MSKIHLKWALVAAAILFGVGAFFVYYLISVQASRQFRVTFLNVGQGDSALINFGNGQKMLVDCGPDKSVLFRLGARLPLFDRKIDYLVATHPDRDHYGGCIDVLQRYRVSTIVINGRAKTYDPYWRAWSAAVGREGARVVAINGHDTWHVGSSTIEFFSPDAALALPPEAAESNNYSIVFKLIAPRGKTFLFTGDMEEPLEQLVIKKYCPNFTITSTSRGITNCPALKADTLKVGHHGSNSSSGEALLRAVAPQTAVISVGKNKYGHPSRRVIRRLERAGATILRTDLLGDIVID